ncbi:RNA polymerase sigma factor sigS [Staphylococcus piscifermentans]|uniref:RNA polymerase sigma factor SigS n=1 Tax=Staphylococcus piscifermentans TaxID=70258 RepID=A0A239TZG8_9STAP|nr:sigma-70 family RNA polymerase sigma factor [Staphylococcus piscifermentans]RTX86865.1 sigma-70 family RNA polymerase sigma factor [Staphylococcus piscifermentans]GEP84376.1 RNA polymerase sigma factor SigS [Staphylococcus piscifermentans]SNV02985.1 RNA polymerase sigma factor sigS [Staphylococcus piscifermentans]
MNIEHQISRNKGIIYSLLHKYNIRYDSEEYAQLLTIKMWELIRQFDMSIHNSMSRYLFQRLHFYLVDLFRSKGRQPEISTIDLENSELNHSLQANASNILPLMTADYYHLLNEHERLWLNLKLFGYKQFEIQKLMDKSATSIRKYQQRARLKLEPLRQFLKGGL